MAVTDWRSEAACRGMDAELFFPERGDPAETAKAVCARCTVKEPCLAYGLALPSSMRQGIWGGQSISDSARRQRARRAS